MNPNQAGQQQADCCVGSAKAATPPISAKGAAAVLRDTAARLDAAAADLPRNARDVIRQCSPPDSLCCVDAALDVRLIGRHDFNPLDFMRRDAAHRLGAFIAGKQTFELKMPDNGMVPAPRPTWGPEAFIERYTARLHVFSPSELQALVERAIEIGRNTR